MYLTNIFKMEINSKIRDFYCFINFPLRILENLLAKANHYYQHSTISFAIQKCDGCKAMHLIEKRINLKL